jgi:MoaE-MoaD fusion protein
MQSADQLLLTGQPLTLEPALQAIVQPAWGGQAFFTGTVRTPNKGLEIAYLEYEAYAPMCHKVFEKLCTEARSRWDLGAIYLAHRTGRVLPAELSIIVAVSSPHRRAALESCDFLIEAIKVQFPVWKLERSSNGESWEESWVEGASGFETL